METSASWTFRTLAICAWAAARLARYRKPDLATSDVIEGGLLKAWEACGAERDHGGDYAVGAIRRALKLGANDELPPLAHRFRGARHG